MTVENILDRMPTSVKVQLDHLRALRKFAEEDDSKFKYWKIDNASSSAAMYCKGLMDAGLITDRERMKLYIYTTV